MITIYGIKHCDTMKKTFTWFDSNDINYSFHNYKTENISTEKLAYWMRHTPMEKLVNTKGTTYKGLSEAEKMAVLNPHKSKAIIQRNPSILKRPIVEFDEKVVVGFLPEEWKQTLSLLHE